MAGRLLSKKWSKSGKELPAPKRISTPAGLRLSLIMNEPQASTPSEGPASSSTPKRLPQLSFSKGFGNDFVGTTVFDADLESGPQSSAQSPARQPSPSPPYTKSTFSEKSALPTSGGRNAASARGCFGWVSRKKLVIILGATSLILLLGIIGLAVGLTRKHATSKSSQSSSSENNTPSSSSSSSSPSLSPSSSPSSTIPVSKDFPLGSYSMHTFLDTIQSNCTSSTSTWTCPPNVIFNDDASKALSTFSYTITGSSNSYQLAPTEGISPFGDITFKATPLLVVNAGQSSERYRFQVTINKAVDTTIDGQAATCHFNATTFQGYLYTKMTSDYPLQGQQIPSGGSPQWPFAARFEEVAGGGEGVPNCVAAGTNQPITKGISAQDAGSLCSCLYKNWRTPTSWWQRIVRVSKVLLHIPICSC